MRILKYAYLFLLFISCREIKERDYLEEALSFAGENRTELEQVLSHYSSNPDDSLKYKAAVFLIENMPGHTSSKYTDLIEAYYNELNASISSDNNPETNWKRIEEISARHRNRKIERTVEDIRIITADYLINNIEQAFDSWQNGEWATHISFDDFCEYILPYKGGEEQPLDNWREYTKDMLKADLDTLHYCDLYRNSAFQAATVVSKEIIKLNHQQYPTSGINCIPVKDIRTLAQIPFGSCEDYVLLALAVMRSKGIPVMSDFTPQWPFQAQSHAWNIVQTNQGRNMIFSAGSSNPGELHNPDSKMAKVFRRTYAINREIQNIHKVETYIPPIFKTWSVKDVTDEYMATTDVEIVIPDSLLGKYSYGYIAVFDNRNWAPIHYAKVERKKIRFDKMGRNCMYLPVFYDEQGIVPFSTPFHITTKGEIQFHEIDKGNLSDLTVYRKYFIAGHCYEVGHRLEGGIIQASNQVDFNDAITLFTIPGFTVQSGEIELDTLENKYRYWRYYSAEGRYNNLAELYFYQNTNENPIREYKQIIGTKGSYANRKEDEKEAVFDDDPLTFFDAPTPSNSWVGVDFGQPVKIDRIAYTPRGDGNDITPGDIHEFLYWDNGWISLGKEKATDIKLNYKAIPSGTLYWMRNLSRGNNERIFTYENEKLIWW